ncbi:hypothetical protein JCM19992_18790 [Thermostilla marina]
MSGHCSPVARVAIWGGFAIAVMFAGYGVLRAESPDPLAKAFQEVPKEARRLTGPLFWLHGDETPDRLREYLRIVAEGGNGCFTAESRPHSDWLGPGWYRDLAICLDEAKRLGLEMWIFDEKWWPSGEVGGNVPKQYGSKFLEVEIVPTEGKSSLAIDVDTRHLVALVGALRDGDAIVGDSLIDLTPSLENGNHLEAIPEKIDCVLVFTWRYAEGRRGRILVDGASRDAVEWYLQTVYQPHYDHFKEDFGKTIRGYFYDEPETIGDWGTEVIPELKARGIDWRRALVSWKLQLADPEEQAAYNYQYRYALAEAWGKTLYGGISRWCRAHDVVSIGHWLEHRHEYLHPLKCAGDMVQLQKYTDMGGIDAVFKQFVPGQKDDSTYQTPKLGSSITHAYGKQDDLTMVEIFGARGQDLTYPEMKWWTDLMHVAGVNFHIPHSFNPKSPYDRDCPPYFYNGGYEPRWPLYRVYADYTSRLSLMLSGGRHICPVALVYLGQSYHVGKAIPPETMTTALQDALYDCDWIPYDVLVDGMKIDGKQLVLRNEAYRVLILPAAEVVPFEVLEKAHRFFEAGGVVVGYGIRPRLSATPGKTSDDVATICRDLWGDAQPGLGVCRTNERGGRTYFVPSEVTSEQVLAVLAKDADVSPVLEVLDGDTRDWLHVLHRVKDGRDVFFVANQLWEGPVETFRLRTEVRGVPELWDPLRNEIRSIPFSTTDGGTEFTLRLHPLQSVLIVFRASESPHPQWIEDPTGLGEELLVVRKETPRDVRIPHEVPLPERAARLLPKECAWVWAAAESAMKSKPGTWGFRKNFVLAEDAPVEHATLIATADNAFEAFVNGKRVGGGDNWQRVYRIPVEQALQPGKNVIAVSVFNGGEEPNPAGLIGALVIEYGTRRTVIPIDTTWKATAALREDWNAPDCDTSDWSSVVTVASLGDGPWGDLGNGVPVTRSPAVSDPFFGEADIPADWLNGRATVYLVMNGIAPEEAARVTINEKYAGGVIGRPLRLDVTSHLSAGRNTILIEPFAPKQVRLIRVAD